jgi:hypothetical protein
MMQLDRTSAVSSVIDLAPYMTNQLFRLPGNAKFGKAPLVPHTLMGQVSVFTNTANFQYAEVVKSITSFADGMVSCRNNSNVRAKLDLGTMYDFFFYFFNLN